MKLPPDDGHRSTNDPLLSMPDPDHRITDLEEEGGHRNPLDQYHTLLQDTFRTLQVNVQRFMHSNPLQMGLVVHAIPYVNWYKVQVGEGGSFIPCCMASESSFTPMGVRSGSPITANTTVLVFCPPGLTYGIIIGAFPDIMAQNKPNVPGWIQQGGNTGLKREKGPQHVFKQLFREGGTKDWSNQRPMDGTSLEWTKFSETGIGILIDSFQAFLRVNEACGLFLNYWDSHTRLAGMSLEIQGYAEQIENFYDEGENQLLRANLIYPWESTGCYDSGVNFTSEFGDKEVQYDIKKGKVDLPDGEEDIQVVMRAGEYGGYLGQGWQRLLMAPEQQGGKRHYKDEPKDYGLFQELIALDGSYTMRSAKSVYIGKRVLIPIPKRKRLREDQKEGDDARKSNYKFSSKFGGGEDHKVGDVEVNGEEEHMLRVAGVLDLLSYNYNWKGIHPFHYHKEDYKLWQESELQPFSAATDNLNFGELASKDFMQYPSPRQVRVDHRYNQVDYFQRESFIAWHEDGGLSIGCGYGAQIALTAGQIRLEAPGDVLALTGKRFVALGWETIIRAKNSVDISATEKDVRIKAEKNMQMVAGNGGRGGILIHSKSTSKTHVYKDMYGEDVVSSGVVLLAKQSQVAALAHEIYLRTGGGELKDGDITIDASKGRKRVVYYGKNHHFFCQRSVDIWHAPTDESANMVKSHRFSRNFSKIDGNLIIEKNVCIVDGNCLVRKNIVSGKNILAKKNIACEKNLAVGRNIAAGRNIIAKKKLSHLNSPFVAPHDGSFDVPVDVPLDGLDQCEEARQKHIDQGEPAFEGEIVQRWYQSPTMLGNEELLFAIGFSYRDPPGSPRQYKTEQFKLPETRWQQYARLGLGSGGTGWTEKPVQYQGQDTYPWPGKQKWVSEPVMLEYQEHTIFDDGQRHSKDRPGPYEEPKLSDWTPKTLDGNWKTII